jgi:alpha-tubulin suppressor-like RCC1 family protein
MPNPNTNFKLSDGRDLGSVGLTKEYLMTVYPQIANQLITPELWVWGWNIYAQLGINAAGNRCTPVTTSAGGANWKQVSSGDYQTAAIKTDGTLWIWGRNPTGQLGVNDTNNRCTPVTTFAGGTNWKQVECGYHTAAIKTDGTLWVWGNNSFGSLGINVTTTRCTPVTTFAGGTNWKQVSCGGQHTAAIKTDGTLWTWGLSDFGYDGALGINVAGAAGTRCTPVTTFAGGTNWKQVSCGNFHTAAIKTDGTLWIWGSNSYGKLGINNTTTPICTPVTTFAGGTNWKQVACGQQYTAAIKTDGTLWVWGQNTGGVGPGALGTNDTTNRSTPVTTFAGGTNWKQVACGQQCTAAIKTDGTLWVWGYNVSGQLGVNDTNLRCTPVTTFAGGTNWKQVSRSTNQSQMAAIKTSDDLIGI